MFVTNLDCKSIALFWLVKIISGIVRTNGIHNVHQHNTKANLACVPSS